MLASVRSASEARIVLDGGADLIDLKEPARGALGAVAAERAREILGAVGGAALTSATIGDLPACPTRIERAVAVTGTSGVDFVKVGLFPGEGQRDCVRVLGRHCRRGTAIVVVLFADLQSDWTLLPLVARSGCSGIMLDTARKGDGRLTCFLESQRIAGFIDESRNLGLLTGVAGSLQSSDIETLLALDPDFLGFRGALCSGGERVGAIDPAAVRQIRSMIPQAASDDRRRAGDA
jgi:dihydroneopterin aldolase